MVIGAGIVIVTFNKGDALTSTVDTTLVDRTWIVIVARPLIRCEGAACRGITTVVGAWIGVIAAKYGSTQTCSCLAGIVCCACIAVFAKGVIVGRMCAATFDVTGICRAGIIIIATDVGRTVTHRIGTDIARGTGIAIIA
jgi:hypothetical protein